MKSGLQYAGRGLTTPLRGRGSLGENQFQSMTGQRRADASPRRPPAPGCAADSMLRPRLLLALVLLSSGTRVSRRGLALLCSSLHLNHLRILSVCPSVCRRTRGRGEGGSRWRLRSRQLLSTQCPRCPSSFTVHGFAGSLPGAREASSF